MALIRRNGKIVKRDGKTPDTTNAEFLQEYRAKKAMKHARANRTLPATDNQISELRALWNAAPIAQ